MRICERPSRIGAMKFCVLSEREPSDRCCWRRSVIINRCRWRGSAVRSKGDRQGTSKEKTLPSKIYWPIDWNHEEALASQHRSSIMRPINYRLHLDCAVVLRSRQFANLPGKTSRKNLLFRRSFKSASRSPQGIKMHSREKFYPSRYKIRKYSA